MPASQPSADTAVVRARIVHLLSICRAAPHGNDRHHLPVPAPHSILNRNSNFHLHPITRCRFSLRLLFQLLTCLHSVPLGDARELTAAEMVWQLDAAGHAQGRAVREAAMREWTIYRRYSQFDELKNCMAKSFPEATKAFKFPPKVIACMHG